MRKLLTLLSICILSITLTTAFTLPSASAIPKESRGITVEWNITGGGTATIYINNEPLISTWGSGSTTYYGSFNSFDVYISAAPGYVIPYAPYISGRIEGGVFTSVSVTAYCISAD